MQPGADGSVLPEHEFRNFFCLLVAAGNGTTCHFIAAGIQALAHQPELLARIRSGPMDDTMADEIIRRASPTSYFRRTAAQDFDLHDKRIRTGDKVLFSFASANRDEAEFDDRFRVDLGRTPNRHLAFGQGGPHLRLGS